jgi:hypothetical protein
MEYFIKIGDNSITTIIIDKQGCLFNLLVLLINNN